MTVKKGGMRVMPLSFTSHKKRVTQSHKKSIAMYWKQEKVQKGQWSRLNTGLFQMTKRSRATSQNSYA